MELNERTDTQAVAIRPYRHADAAGTLAIFLAAVTETACADYSPEQIQAWARPDARDLSAWHAAMQKRPSYVATVDGAPVGFSDVNPAGYIDMLFVAPRHQRQKDLLGSEVRLSGHLVCHTEEQMSTVRDHLPTHLSLTRAEPGCRSFNVTTTNNPLIWRVEECFEHAAAFAAHQERVAGSAWGQATSGIERRYSVTGR